MHYALSIYAETLHTAICTCVCTRLCVCVYICMYIKKVYSLKVELSQ